VEACRARRDQSRSALHKPPRALCLHVPLFNPSKHNPSTINIPPNNVKIEIIADYPMYHRFMNQYFRTIEPKKNPVAGTILTNFWVWKIIDLSLYAKVWFSFRVLANLAGKTHKSAPNLVQIEQIPRYHPHIPKHPQASFLKLPWYAKPVPFRICREPHQN